MTSTFSKLDLFSLKRLFPFSPPPPHAFVCLQLPFPLLILQVPIFSYRWKFPSLYHLLYEASYIVTSSLWQYSSIFPCFLLKHAVHHLVDHAVHHPVQHAHAVHHPVAYTLAMGPDVHPDPIIYAAPDYHAPGTAYADKPTIISTKLPFPFLVINILKPSITLVNSVIK